MITSWHMIPLCIGTKQVSEIEAKLDIDYVGRNGWALVAVLIEDLDGERMNAAVRIEADGSVADGDKREMSLMGPAIVSAANHYYSANKCDILDGLGLFDAAE